MFEAKVLSGSEFPYHPKNNPTETRMAYEMWFSFQGVPFSFKMVFFNQDQIEKAKAGVAAGKCQFALKPDYNVRPIFVLA